MNPDDYLQMSGIQHFCFCRRQWALAYMEQQWAENLRTAEGRLLHERCHDDSLREKRGDLITVRDLRVVSHRLRLAGNCDVVEFRAAPEGVALQGYDGLWQPLPVEYKRGAPKASDADRLQLCAQAMALEEMLVCTVPRGAIFYGETRRREWVELTAELRQKTQKMASEMNDYFAHREHWMALFIKRDYLSGIAMCLGGLSAYVGPDNQQDLQSELGKARTQILMTGHLFFSML